MSFIEIIKVIFLGIVEGVTEWLPISSTGHMYLVDEFIKLDITPEFREMFMVVIQLGAILSVVVLFWNKLFPYSFKQKKVNYQTINLWFKIIVSCLPAAVLGLLFDDFFDKHFYNHVVISITLILYGILFIVIEKWNESRIPTVTKLKRLPYKSALIIGLFQVLSLIPGTSRSGATILGALLIGTSRTVAAEFTFFLAIPIMFGASLLKMVKFGFHYTSVEVATLLLGCSVAFIVSLFSIKFLMNYVKKHNFTFFGYYRIILGVVVLLLFQFIL